MTTSERQTIPFAVVIDEKKDPAVLSAVSDNLYQRFAKFVDLPTLDIKEQVASMEQVTSAVSASAATVNGFGLEEVKFTIGVSANGKVAIVGTGVSGSVSGTIELLLRRSKD